MLAFIYRFFKTLHLTLVIHQLLFLSPLFFWTTYFWIASFSQIFDYISIIAVWPRCNELCKWAVADNWSFCKYLTNLKIFLKLISICYRSMVALIDINKFRKKFLFIFEPYIVFLPLLLSEEEAKKKRYHTVYLLNWNCILTEKTFIWRFSVKFFF